MQRTQRQKASLAFVPLCFLLMTLSLLSPCWAQAGGRPTAPNDVLVLVVTEDELGTRADWQKNQFFYLYTGGRVVSRHLEEDEHDHQPRPVRREFTISNEDYRELLGLLDSDYFLDSEGVPALWNGVSPMVFLTIQYHHPQHPKTIFIADYNPTDPTGGGAYPESVAKLLAKIESLRGQGK